MSLVLARREGCLEIDLAIVVLLSVNTALRIPSQSGFGLPVKMLLAVMVATLLPVLGRAAGGANAAPASSVLVHRTFMPEAGPSSFAVQLGPYLGFCYDPGRGGINYLWQGEFVDLAPTWKAKINGPAILRGEIVYRESVRWPLRLNGSREPVYAFQGYALLADGVEFHYTLDGVAVKEEIRLAADARGLVRRFRLSEPCTEWSYAVEPQAGVAVSGREGAWDEARRSLRGAGTREIELRVELKGGAR